jgi:DNA-binding MurR/RpiR family transcriptional regulator
MLVTDQWLSPISRFAKYVVAGRTAMPSAWDSSASLFVIAESLIDAVTRRLETEGARRIREMEGLR